MKTKNEERLEARLDCLDSHGACFLDLGRDEPAAPDYSGIAATNAESARLAKAAADDDIAFRKQVYNENKPYTEAAQRTGLDAAQAQLGIMKKADERSDMQWDRYTNTFIPVEDQMVKEAMDYGGEADQAMQAGRAVADVRTQSALADASSARAMAAMGVNPNSGRFAGMKRGSNLMQSAEAAGASTNARAMARDKGIGLRAGVASFGRNMTNTAGQMAGIGTGAGSAGVGSATAGANAGLGYANYASGGTGGAISAASIAQQGALGFGGMMSGDYRAGLSASAQGGDLGSAILGMGTKAALGSAFGPLGMFALTK